MVRKMNPILAMLLAAFNKRTSAFLGDSFDELFEKICAHRQRMHEALWLDMLAGDIKTPKELSECLKN